MKWFRKSRALLLVITAIFLTVHGFAASAKIAVGRDYTVPAGVTEKEVSVSLGDLTVDGVVTGLAKVSAGNALVRGQVGGNLSVSLGDAVVEGRVGGQVDIKQGDFVLTGEAGNGASVALGDATISGKLTGPLRISNGDLILKGGSIDGDVVVVVGDVTLEGGEIKGSLTVKGGRVHGDISIVKGAISVSEFGGAEIDLKALEDLPKTLERIGKSFALPAGLLVILLLAILSVVFFVIVFGLVMAILYVVRIPTSEISGFLKREEILATLLSGVAGALVLIAAIGLLAATIVFVPVAFFLACLAVVGIVFGFAALVMVVGRAVFRNLLKWHLPDWLTTLLGFLLLLGLLIVPLVNRILLPAYLLLSFGVALRAIFGRKQSNPQTGAPSSSKGSPGTNELPETSTLSPGKSDGNSLPAGDAKSGDSVL